MSLSNRFIREMSLDIDKALFGNVNTSQNNAKHTFVSGLARSGTTIILRALYESNEYASLTYSDMPFVLAPNCWKKTHKSNDQEQSTERAHGDGIMVSTSAPEAFEEVYWKTLDESEALDGFSSYIDLILERYKKERYLSKNNQNVNRLDKLIKLFPNSTFLIPFRDPLQHSQSLHTQHLRFCQMQEDDVFVKDYMDWIGHSEFGLSYVPVISDNLHYPDAKTFDHWLEQWVLLYSSLMTQHQNAKNVSFICYERLCSHEDEWKKLLNTLELDGKRTFEFTESYKEIGHSYSDSTHSKARLVYAELASLSNKP